eukprot:PhF_6_TR6990/c1_g1_i1/m.10364
MNQHSKLLILSALTVGGGIIAWHLLKDKKTPQSEPQSQSQLPLNEEAEPQQGTTSHDHLISEYSDQLDALKQILTSDTAKGYRRELIADAMPIVDDIVHTMETFPEDIRQSGMARKVFQQVEEIVSLLGEEIGQNSKAATTSSHHRNLLERIFKSITNKDEIKSFEQLTAFTNLLKECMKTDEMVQDEVCMGMIQECITALGDISARLSSQVNRSSMKQHSSSGEDDENVPLLPEVESMITQLTRVAGVLDSTMFSSLQASRVEVVYETASLLLQGVTELLSKEGLPKRDRDSLLQASSAMVTLLKKQEANLEESEQETEKPEENIESARKLNLLIRYRDVLGASTFESLHYNEQMSMIRSGMELMQTLTPEESVLYQEIVDEISTVITDAFQHMKSQQTKANENNNCCSEVIDLLPSLCHRISEDSFVETTSPFQLEMVSYIVEEGDKLWKSIDGEAQGAVREIIQPLKLMLFKLQQKDDFSTTLGVEYKGPEFKRQLMNPTEMAFCTGDEELTVSSNTPTTLFQLRTKNVLTFPTTKLALLFAEDNADSVAMGCFAQGLESKGFQVIRGTGSEAAFFESCEVITEVVNSSRGGSMGVLVFALSSPTSQLDTHIDQYLTSTKATTSLVSKVSHFVLLHDRFDTFTAKRKHQPLNNTNTARKAQPCFDSFSMKLSLDAVDAMVMNAFPFPGLTWMPCLMEAMQESTFHRTWCVEELMNHMALDLSQN